ncbi:uncharacterized protein QC763_500390 [Podospora pseudopauciseta]|uniref:Infection structure specific protein n=1 Tax=Podospora pseudopauciseta TaxID=2093780 RepID=A0ABR0H7P7_9PEZI|nr:hypothetical protein QC763_500390 [Podospora pseudopauciseta]
MPSQTLALLAGAMTLATVGAQLPTSPILPIPFPQPPYHDYSPTTVPTEYVCGNQFMTNIATPTPPPNRPEGEPKKSKKPETEEDDNYELKPVKTHRTRPFAAPTGRFKSLQYPYTSVGRHMHVLERTPADCTSQTSELTVLAAQQPIFPPELQDLAKKHKVWFSACGPTFENAVDSSFDPQAFTPAFEAWSDALATNLRRLMNACHSSQETVDTINRDRCLRDLLAQQAPVIPLGPIAEDQATFTTMFTLDIPVPSSCPDPVTITKTSTMSVTATVTVEENKTVVIDKMGEGVQGVAVSLGALLTGVLAGAFIFAL